jgi:hypothetical protein
VGEKLNRSSEPKSMATDRSALGYDIAEIQPLCHPRKRKQEDEPQPTPKQRRITRSFSIEIRRPPRQVSIVSSPPGRPCRDVISSRTARPSAACGMKRKATCAPTTGSLVLKRITIGMGVVVRIRIRAPTPARPELAQKFAQRAPHALEHPLSDPFLLPPHAIHTPLPPPVPRRAPRFHRNGMPLQIAVAAPVERELLRESKIGSNIWLVGCDQ